VRGLKCFKFIDLFGLWNIHGTGETCVDGCLKHDPCRVDLERLFLVRLLTSLSSKLVAFGMEGQGLILIIFRRSVQWTPTSHRN